MTKLKCGCDRGKFLCPEAVRLWNEVNRAYESRDWKNYDQAWSDYYAHYGEVNP